MVRELGVRPVATNRRARHDFHIDRSLEAGMVLTGTEVKSLREGRASLADGFAVVEKGEVWLENVHIPEFFQGSWTNHSTRRRRKLLLKKGEILKLASKTRESGVTLVPMSIYFRDGRAKVEIALARGKKEFDKRHSLKEAQDVRESARAFANKGKDW